MILFGWVRGSSNLQEGISQFSQQSDSHLAGGEGGIRTHQLYGNKGVLRRSSAFQVMQKKATELLVPLYCP
jgi:hypothetical protein